MSKRAFLFPGQGAQYVGMGKDLADVVPAAKRVFEQANEALGLDIAAVCFEGPEEQLLRTDLQQPAILTHAIAALEALRERHVAGAADDAQATCGLSLGEYGALVFAGVLDFQDAVRLVRKRGEAMQKACEAHPSGMAAVLKLDHDQISAICSQAAEEAGEACVMGNVLSATNVTISGGLKAIERAVVLVKEQRGRALQLEVAGAFHSPYMKPAEEELAGEIERTTFREARIPVVGNVDATPTIDTGRIRANLLAQLASPVKWAQSMAHLGADGFDVFVEVGPGRALTGALKKAIPDARLINIGTLKDLESFAAS